MDDSRRSLLALVAALGAGCVSAPSEVGTQPETTTPLTDGSTATEEPASEGPPPDVAADSLSALVAGNTEFALALHQELVAESPDANLFASPFSISAALAMTWAGAEGETESAMTDALRFELDQDAIHPAFEALTATVEPDKSGSDDATTTNEGDRTTDDEDETEPGFQLRVANALWGQEGFPFDESFIDLLERHYGAGMNEVDFEGDPDAARQTINEWVAEETEEKIEDLLPEGVIDTLTRLVLTNAIYFKAKWVNTFEEDATADREFTSIDGSTADVPTMTQTETFPYAEVDGHQVVDLPYAGGDTSMVVVLPAEGTFEQVERSVDANVLGGLFDALERTSGTIALPRFTFESAFSLKNALSALGMEVAFDPNAANFDGMIEDGANGPNLYVQDAVHKSFVAVDEDGTEAAAATGVVAGVTSAIEPQFEMVVDRPFLFFVRHRETDSILFSGRVVDGEALQE